MARELKLMILSKKVQEGARKVSKLGVFKKK